MKDTIVLKRLNYEDKQITGEMTGKHGKLFTLELPDKANQKRISCIPKGVYDAKIRFSEKYKEHFHIIEVPNRDFILIHSGNYHTQILGCVLVGTGLADINKDGYKDVTNSRAAMRKLLNTYPLGFILRIE